MENQTFKVCSKCNEEKSINNFYFRSDTNKYRSECGKCRNKYNLELYHKSTKQKENHRKSSWKHQIKKNYGLTPEDYHLMLENQEGKCKICDMHVDDLEASTLYIDHCHTTGKVRGLLCNLCNTGLGMFKDNIHFLLKAKEYLDDNSSM